MWLIRFYIYKPLNNIPPPVTCEDEQAFLDRHFETLQHVSEMPNRKGTGGQSLTRPSVVGPLGVASSAIDLVRYTMYYADKMIHSIHYLIYIYYIGWFK